jgi:hypothetical protein
VSEPDVGEKPIYRDQVVRLCDLVLLDDVIDGVTFENCEIHGPAVIFLTGETTMADCEWSGDAEAILWPAYGRDYVVGAIGLRDCTITGCQFFRVGMLVPDDQMDVVQAGFGLE